MAQREQIVSRLMSASLIGRLGSSNFRLSTVAVSMSLTGSCFSTESAPMPQMTFKQGRDRTMRMMLKMLIPTETGNHAIKDGSLHKIFETTMSKIKPEAAYFVAEHGQCCAEHHPDAQEVEE